MGEMTGLRDRARSTVPTLPSSLVVRSRLDGHYRAAVGQVVRVLAPAGYGKSTLVARWVGDDPRPVRWLDVERVDNDPVVLLAALSRSLDDLVDAPVGEPDADLARPLRAAIRTSTTPFVLVLDDVHLLDDPAAVDLLHTVAESIPPESTLVLAGRAHHDEVASLRLRPGVVDLTSDELAFDLAETEQLVTSSGLPVDVEALTQLDEQFEGWPAGLRLASLALASPSGQVPTPLAQAGEITHVTDYLRAEWLQNLADDERDLLMEAAALGRFTAEMCDSVLERSGSATIIRRLDRDQLVVLPLDRRGDWYGMHALLRRWLDTELRRQDRARWHDVHAAAARWWEHHGDVDLALEHLELIEDLDRYEELVVEHSAGVIAHGRSATVRRWLMTLPADRIRRSADLCAVEAVQAIAAGDGARAVAWTRMLGSPSTSAGAPSEAWTVRADIIRASLEVRPAIELLPLAEQAREAAEPGPWRAYACLTLGGLLALSGDDRALDVLADGASEGIAGTAPTMAANCLAVAAVLTDIAGDHERAAAMGATAVEIIGDMRVEQLAPAAGTVIAVRSLAHARAGRHDRAATDIDQVRQILRGFEDVGPWYNVVARLALVRASLLVDDPDTARKLLRDIEHHLRHEPPGGRMAAYVEGLREKVDAARRIATDRSWSLTAAELRVVRYLPTNLSLSDIATRLFVSRNTVKSHTSSIYRKLGTTSRSGAVELARKAGLLDEDGIDAAEP